MPRTQPAPAAKITPASPNNTDFTADESRPQDSVETVIKLKATPDQSAIAAKPARARPGRPAKPAASLPKLPHERDESINTTGTVASEAMEQAARTLIGEHDFSSFRSAECQAASPVKQLRQIEISRHGAYWRFDFEGSAFLHHMVRNIMGCLITIGQGKQSPDWMAQVLHARSRAVAAPTFAPDGLYFLGPRYAPHWGLPERTDPYDGLP